MRYVIARLNHEQRELAYRFYVTDSLQLAPQNMYKTVSFSELIMPEKIDNRSGDEVAFDVINKLGLSFE